MASLQWDSGDRAFETGIDRGVLYLTDGIVVPWNGLTGMDENETRNASSYYIDGQKYLDSQIPGEFAGTLKAYTYPDEFDSIANYIPDQTAETFCLSYRTLLDNDQGYQIHIIYNALANLSEKDYNTESDSPSIIEFSWNLTATPEDLTGFRATSHILFDSRFASSDLMNGLEAILYGTDDTDPSLPDLQELINQLIGFTNILIIDGGDGTWSAYGPDEDVYLTDSTTFEIDNVDVTIVDSDTYIVSTTPL